MNAKVIVTGAAGHLGGALMRKLAGSGVEARGLLLPGEKGFQAENLRYFTGDVTRPETLAPLFEGALPGETAVIHAAGRVSIASGQLDRLIRVNVGGTENVAEACRAHGARMVYVSSVHALPEQKGAEPQTESDFFSPERVTGDYAVSKAMASRRVLQETRNGLDAVIVHPSGMLGPYDGGSNHIVQLLKMFQSGRLPAGVKGGYDFVDVRDVADGCLAAAQKGRAGECFLLTNRFLTIAELLETARRFTGGRRARCLPLAPVMAAAPLAELAARLTRTRPLFTRYALYTLSTGSRFSHEKATRELGYAPREIAETVRDTLSWLQQGE